MSWAVILIGIGLTAMWVGYAWSIQWLENKQREQSIITKSYPKLNAIIALDDLYQDGELPEPAYLKRRAEKKARLQDLLEDEAGRCKLLLSQTD